MRLRPHSFVSCLLAALFVAAATHTAQAVPTIDVGNHNLLPNTAGQTVEFFITDSDQPAAEADTMEFDIEVGQGSAGPPMTNVDLKTGTIFADSAFAQDDPVTGSHARQSTIVTTANPPDNEVPLDGMIATVTFDTSGIPQGTYDLDLTGVAGSFDTSFADATETGEDSVPISVTNGSLTVVPEPASLALLSAGGLLMLSRRTRRAAA